MTCQGSSTLKRASTKKGGLRSREGYTLQVKEPRLISCISVNSEAMLRKQDGKFPSDPV